MLTEDREHQLAMDAFKVRELASEISKAADTDKEIVAQNLPAIIAAYTRLGFVIAALTANKAA